MDRHSSRQSAARREFLSVAPAQQNIRRRSVTPVTLERRWISMEHPATTTSPSAPGQQTSSAAAASASPKVTTTATESSRASTATKDGQPVTPGMSSISATFATGQTAVQTSSSASSGAVVASASSASPGHRESVNPATSTSSLAAATAPPTRQTPALVSGEQHRPPGAQSPAANLSTMLSSEEGDGGARVSPAPDGHGKDSKPTRQQATREELKSPQAGQRPEDKTNTLSTGDQHAARQPPRAASHSDRGREPARRTGNRLAVQFSDESPSSPRPSPRDVGDVMQFFAEQEKSLQDSFLSLPKKSVKKQRSPSPKVSPAPGLEHLDNLVRLMEQLGSLKDENSRLRQRCHYLESTKVLLQARKDLAAFEAGGTPSIYKTMPAKQHLLHHRRHHHHHHHQKKSEGEYQGQRDRVSPGGTGGEEGGAAAAGTTPTRRSRISSAEELDYLQFVDSASDQRHKRSKSGLQKRSFSTGSLEVPSELLLAEGSEGETRKRLKSKTKIFSSKSGAKSKSSKSGSKWARVKKVLTGQKIYEDLGTTIRTIRDLGRSSGSHSRHSTSGVSISPPGGSPPSSQVSSGEPRHTDSGVALSNTTTEGAAAAASASKNPLVVVPLINRAETDTASRSEHEGSDSELTCDIWMGPPDWWEEYEARTEGSGRKSKAGGDGVGGEEGGCGASTTNSEVSSVIEVTTMYLGSTKKDAPGTSSSTSSPAATTCSALTVSMTASTISSTSSTATHTGAAVSPATLASVSGDQQFLTVEKFPLSRRQSSPSLNGKDASEEGEDILDELASLSESPTRVLHKSSSCQSADLDLPRSPEFSIAGVSEGRPQSQKTKGYRTAWGRVKDIIHTRKDSVKRRPKKQRSEGKSGVDSEETSEIDVEGLYLEEQWRSGSFGEGLLGRSTPKSSSPVPLRQAHSSQTQASASKTGTSPQGGLSSGVDMAAMLAGRMSDDFNKKMLEWEAKKSRKSASLRVSGEDSDLGSLDVSGASQEFPVRTVDLRDLKGKVPDSSSDTTTPGESHTSLEVLGAHTASPAHLEEIQKRMTDSFSRKMQEWEKLKYRSSMGSQRESSPDIERKGSKSRKDDRQKSKRSREDKEKEKLEKMREREMQKVEKEQVKLEKEKLRLEKERLRALEREAKLEKIKGRLSHTEQQDTGFKNPVLGPLAEYKVTADFAHKLHQWELKKGLSHDVSNSIYLEAQKLNMQHLRAETARHKHLSFSPGASEAAGGHDDEDADGEEKSAREYWDTSGDRSPVAKRLGEGDGEDADAEKGRDVEADVDDDETSTSATEECLVKSNIDTLERANRQLIENLQQKEMEYASVQQQVTEVNRKLAKVKEEHAREMARFHRELALGSIAEPVKLEVGELESTINTMEGKIKAMENLGERLALSMESAAVGKWQSIDGEETVHTQLVELVDQMRSMLVQASHSEEESKKSMALSNFEKLYSHAMKLQIQMNNLRLSHLERNREIMTVKRQLLLQEVNNLLLQADITRRETELYQYQAAKKFASLRRWNTFSGSDRSRPQAQMEVTPKPRVEMQPGGRSRQIDAPHVNIPYIPEEVILASAASSSLSAPASPSAVEAAGGTPHCSSNGGSLSPHHQLLAPTTSSAAGGSSSSVAHVTSSTSPVAGYHHHLHQHTQHQHHHQQHSARLEPQQAREEAHHSSTAASIDPGSSSSASSRHLETRQLTLPAKTTTDTRHPHLLSAPPPASPSLLRAVSDPLQGTRGETNGQSPATQPLKSSPQLSTTSNASSLGRSASDGERTPSRQQLSLAPSHQTEVHSSSTSGTTDHRMPAASGAVHDPSRPADQRQGQRVDDQDQTHRTQTQEQRRQSPAAAQLATSHSPPSASVTPSPNQAGGAATSRNTVPVTSSDSVPLYNEIRELRKAKSIVERGSPTLILSKEGKGSSSAPSPGKSPSRGARTSKPGTPGQTIPRQRSLDASSPTPQGPRLVRAAASIDDDYSPVSTVMTCTKNVPVVAKSDQLQPDQGTESGAVGGAGSTTARLSPRSDTRRDLPPISDTSRTGSAKCPRSPVTKHNYLRRQKEERDTATSGKHLDYKPVSPKSSPVATRGKPPLPRQNTPVRQSPQASPATHEKSPRSKSVGEMSEGSSGAAVSAGETCSHKPLQEAINKFEKRQTMCETDDRPVELRKTPSPTLHLPRVGLVSRVRRLKPAAELLEESQRYRSGHSIYTTRIMQRYLPKEGSKTLPPDALSSLPIVTESGAGQNNKENTFVHAMVRRLSRETSPTKSVGSSRTNSDLSLKRTDSPRSNSEFVSHIVRKLSSGSGSGSPRCKVNPALSPLKDLTNDGQVKKLAQSFDDQHVSVSPDRALSDLDIDKQEQQPWDPTRRRLPRSSHSAAKTQHRKSCEVAMVLASGSPTTTESLSKIMSLSLPSNTDQTQQQQKHTGPSSPVPPPNHQSLPAFPLPNEKALSRHRAATYCSSAQETREMARDTQPPRPASTSSTFDPLGKQVLAASSDVKAKAGKSGRSAASSLSPVRRGAGRGKMGTVGVLCKQSISFDLGVTLYAEKSQAAGGGSPKSTRQVRSWDPSETVKAEAVAAAGETDDAEAMVHLPPGASGVTAAARSRPVSSGSEGETHTEEKNKFRRFLDSNWLQKSKKFFKVSK